MLLVKCCVQGSKELSQIEYMLGKIPMRRMGEPSEVAEVIAFAASRACGFTTGFVFDASGGRATY
jgi:3-oxoacyl-[acyl-carrier protein] reductase